MFRYETAGESHGQCLVATLTGLPAGIPIKIEKINRELWRRQQGYGRGGRMKIETDTAQLVSGVRHSATIGSPIAIIIENRDWKNWTEVLPVEDYEGSGENRKEVTRPRPGHADLAGAQKYGFDDVRNVLERASARETAARVTVGALCRGFLGALGIEVLSHVVQIGSAKARRTAPPGPDDRAAIDASPVRCADPVAARKMVAEIDALRKARDTVGGVFEVLAYGVPPGLGSYVQWDRKLDGRLAGALMSIQSVKGVEVGDGFASARRPGSKAHDEIVLHEGSIERRTARAGGIEGGMSTGQPIRVRAAMKPFSTVPKPLATVDLATKTAAVAIKQRTDVCAVPAGGVVGEAVVAFELANAVLEKFGGDSLGETRGNLERYLETLP